MSERVEYTFWDAVEYLGRKKHILFGVPILAGILAVAIGFALPKWYRAEAQVLPPYSSGGISAGMLGGLVGGIIGLGGEGNFELPFMVSPVDLWGAIVRSRGVADSIIAKFDLMKKYKARNMYIARKRYLSHLYVDVAQEGILTIGYEDKSPDTSAMITNEIVDLLDRTLQRVRTVSARRTKKFLEEQIAKCEQELDSAEQRLINFQKKHRAISLEDQAKVAVENIAQLYAQLSLLEIQVNAMVNEGVSYSPELDQLRAQAKEIRRKISQLETKGDSLILGTPLDQYPDLIMEYANLYRDLKVQEIIYQVLKQQYEQAKIEEQRNVSGLHIIARAEPPQKKYRPKKAIMGVVATIGTFLLVFVILIFEGYLEKLRRHDPETYQKISVWWGAR